MCNVDRRLATITPSTVKMQLVKQNRCYVTQTDFKVKIIGQRSTYGRQVPRSNVVEPLIVHIRGLTFSRLVISFF